MVIVPLDEASKAIYGEGKQLTNTTATLETEKGISYFVEDSKLKPKGESKFFIEGNEMGKLPDFLAPWELIAIDKPWMFDIPRRIKFTPKVIWKNKIDAAVGFTHYVKKGKLFRK